MNKNEVLKKIKKKLFEIPKKEDVDRAVKFIDNHFEIAENEIALIDKNYLNSLAEIIKILEDKNGK